MKNHRRHHIMRLRLAGRVVEFRLKCVDATKTVTLSREERDALNGYPGSAVECMNAQCGLRSGPKIFGHPVYFAEFTDTRAWFAYRIRKKDGAPTHCVCYAHNQGSEQRQFDSHGGKKRMLRNGLVKKDITLFPPKRYYNPGLPHKEVRHQTHPALFRGSLARAKRAGLITEGLLQKEGE